MSRVKKSFWLVMKPILISTGLPVEMRFCSANNANATKALGLSPATYPYIMSEPSYEINVFDGEFTGTASVTIDGFELSNTNKIGQNFDDYVWDGCDVTVYSGLSNASTIGELTSYFVGVVEKSPVVTPDGIKISLTDKLYLLDKEIFTTTYLGTGGMEGTAEMEGVPKPFSMGYPLNIAPVLVDPAYLIYQYHGYGTAGGVLGLYENGLTFGAGQTAVPFTTNNATTFAALRAKTLTAGQWVDCPSLGMFRLGGEPVSGGVISADVAGFSSGGVVALLTDVVNKLVTEAGQSALVDASSYTGFQTATYNQIISDYYESPINAKETIDTYLSQVGGYSFVNSTGKIRLGLVRMSTPSLTIRTDGTTSPVVEDGISLPTSAPYKRVKMGADRVFKVHALNEISDKLYQTVFALNTTLSNLSTEVYLAASDTVLTIDEKIRILKPADAELMTQYTNLTSRATALGLTYATLTTAYNNYTTTRNAISPAWNNITVNSTGINASFRGYIVTLADELIILNKRISEEDAKRADWVQTSGRPPLLTGEGVTVDEFLLDPSVWTHDAVNGAFSNAAAGDGWFYNTGNSVANLCTKFANATPIDQSASYEVSIDLIQDGTGTGTATSYLGVVLYDANGTVIMAGEGTFWHYFKAAEAVYERGKWETYSVRVGKGTTKPFPANASKFGLVAYVNYNNLSGVTCRVRRMKSRRVTDQSWTAAIPNRWTLANGRIVRHVGAYSWGNIAYGRAGIKGPQRFSWRWSGQGDDYSTMCGLSETATPVNFTDGVFTALANDVAGSVLIYEGGVDKATYTGQTDRNTAEFAIEYDGLRLRLFKNGVAYGYSRFVGPDKTYYPFVDTYYHTGTGIIDVKHASTQSAAVVGSNTYTDTGGLLGGPDLLNAEQLWSDVDGAGRPADNATSDISLTSIGTFTVTITGNTIKGSATSGFENTARTPIMFGSCFAEVDIVDGGYTILSLDDNPSEVYYNQQQLYVEYLKSNGVLTVIRNGADVINALNIGANLTGKIRITYDKIRYRIYIAEQEVAASTATYPNMVALATTNHYAKFCAYTSNSIMTGCRASLGSSSNLWAEVGGTGRPENNATVGARAGTNLVDSGGATLNDGNIRNEDIRVAVDTAGTGGRARARIFRDGGVTLVNEVQLPDVVQNLNQQWADVSGTGRPADNATVGADWDSNVSDRPVELTDGRIDTGLDTGGRNKVGIVAGGGVVANEALLEGITGTQLHPNPEFTGGSFTGWTVYDNSGSGKITLALAYDSGMPNGTDYRLAITYDGTGTPNVAPQPSYGGIHCSLTDAGVQQHSRPNKYARGTFIFHKIRAKIPAGRTINWASNSTGDQASVEWLTSQDGTGEWKLYVLRQYIGRTGTFSSTGFLHIAGGTNTAFTWYVAKWDQIDVTSAPVTFLGSGGLYDTGGAALVDGNVRNEDLRIVDDASGTGGRGRLTIRRNAGGVDIQTIELNAALQNKDQAWADVGGTGKPENNATVGAVAGTNLKDSGGTVLSDGNVRNSDIRVAVDTAGVGGRARARIFRDGGVTLVNEVQLPDVVQNLNQQWADVSGTGRPADNATVGATANVNLRKEDSSLVADPDFLNNRLEGNVLRISTPVGGALSTNGGQTGAIKIALPTGGLSTMVRFYVDVYEYDPEASQTYEVGGYTYSASTWINCFASAVGRSPSVRTVRFGREDGVFCVYIGELAGTWSYPKVRIRDVTAGYSNFEEDKWKEGWALSWKTSAFPSIAATVTKPVAGDAISGINTRREGGTVVGDTMLMNDNQRFDQVIAGYGRPADNATSDIKLTVTGTGLVLSGNRVTRPTGGGSWDSQAYTTDSYIGGAFCSFIPDLDTSYAQSYMMAGLNVDPTADSSYGSIDFAFHTYGTGALAIYESAASIGTFGSYTLGQTVLSVIYDNEYVRYLRDGVEVRSVYVGAGKQYYFDSSVVHGSINNIRFGPCAAANSPVSFTQNAGISADGNNLFKRSNGGTGWTKAVSTETSVGTAFVSARLATQSTFIGLHEVGNTATDYSSLSASWHRSTNGTWYTYMGYGGTGHGTGYTDSTKFMVTYDGAKFRWYADGTLVRTADATADLVFQAGVSIDALNARVSEVQFGPYTDRTWANVAGSGKPENNATVGAIAGTNLKDSGGTVLSDGNVRNSDIRVAVDSAGTGGRARARIFRDGGLTLVNEVQLPDVVQNLNQQWADVSGTGKPVDDANKTFVDANGLIQGVSSGANTVVDNARVLVGARNLMTNSGQFTAIPDWSSNGSTVTLDNTVLYGSYNTLKIIGSGGAQKNTIMRLKPNTQYTISAMVKGSTTLGGGGDTTLHIQNWRDEDTGSLHQETTLSADTSVTTSWKLISQTFRTVDSATLTYCRFYFYPLAAGFTLNVGYVKLEEGNKATDWIQAPEELTSGINSAALTADWPNVSGTGKPENNANNTYVDANGAIQGISTNAGTVVKNTLIQIDASGNFVNAGATGSGTSVSNSLVANRLVSRGSVAAVIEGNTIYRSSGNDDYNSFVSGEAVVGSCFVEAIIPTSSSWTMLAFDTAAATGYYGDQDFVVHANPASGINVYRNGSYLGNPATPSAGQLLRIVYDGINYRIFLDGTQVGSNYAAPTGQRYFPIINAYNGSIRYAGLNYGSYGNQAFVDGSGTLQNVASGAGTVVDNTYASTPNNLIPNSDQTSAMTMTQGYNPNGATFDANLQYASNVGGWVGSYILSGTTTRNLYVHQNNITAGGNDAIAIDIYPTGSFSNRIPVVAGARYIMSCYAQGHRCGGSVGLYFFNQAGVSVGDFASNPQALPYSGAATLSEYARLFVAATAPAGAASAAIYVRKHNTQAGNTESYFWLAAPQLERSNAAGPSPYVPGPATDTRQLGFSGELNADYTLTAQVTTAAPEDVTINADYLGNIIAGQFNKVTTPIVTRAGASARTDNRATYSVTNITGGLVGFVSINNTAGSADKGRATITNCTATGSYQHNIFWDNVLIASYVVRFHVVPADAPIGGGGSGGTGNKSGSFDCTFGLSSTAFVVIGTISNLTKSSGETIRATAPSLSYSVYNPNASVSMAMVTKWQYSPAGANSWTDFPGGNAVGTSADWFAQDFSGNPGYVTCNRNVVPSDGAYDIRFLAAMEYSQSQTSMFIDSGTASVVIGP